MAKYHNNLKYHEDKIDKHNITNKELEFLQELQNELNTQDDLCQANPRFWVIKGSEKLYNVDEADGYELYDADCCETIAENMEEIYKYIRDEELDEICECDGIKREISYEPPTFFGTGVIKITETEDKSNYIELESLEDIRVWLNEYTNRNFNVISYKTVDKTYEDTMFLTQKDAEEHLRSNYYHYSDDAHTYAMTAWRSPRVEKLLNILSTVNFKKGE